MTGRITWFVNADGILERALGNWSRTAPAPAPIPWFRECSGTSQRHPGGRGDQPAPEQHDEPGEAARKPVILVPLEFTERSLQAAKVGLAVARHTEGELVLCHAVFPRVIPFGPANPPWVRDALRHEAMEKMRPALELAKQARVTAHFEIHEGTPTGVILKVARTWGADLMILTAEKQGIWSRLFFGPRTTEQLLDQAECHVMVLRSSPRTNI